MQVSYHRNFARDLRSFAKREQADAIEALGLFVQNHMSPGLNFEPVRSHAGYFTIRASGAARILLKRDGSRSSYMAMAVGNHDYIYASYFKK